MQNYLETKLGTCITNKQTNERTPSDDKRQNRFHDPLAQIWMDQLITHKHYHNYTPLTCEQAHNHLYI